MKAVIFLIVSSVVVIMTFTVQKEGMSAMLARLELLSVKLKPLLVPLTAIMKKLPAIWDGKMSLIIGKHCFSWNWRNFHFGILSEAGLRSCQFGWLIIESEI